MSYGRQASETCLSGAAGPNGLAAAIFVEQGDEDDSDGGGHAPRERKRLAIWRGESWLGSIELQEDAQACCWIAATAPTCFVLCNDGDVGMVSILPDGRLDHHAEIVGRRLPGRLKAIFDASEGLVAVGIGRQCHGRDIAGNWTAIDAGCRQVDSDRRTRGFNAGCAAGPKQLYCVGWGGEIWHRSGSNWYAVVSPTNVILTDVTIAEDGLLWICGRRGILIGGPADRLTIVEHGSTEEDFWAIRWYQHRLFVASLTSLYEFSDGGLRRVDTELEAPDSYYHLSANDEELWSFGPRAILRLRGSLWEWLD